jgi:hypothetical protein
VEEDDRDASELDWSGERSAQRRAEATKNGRYTSSSEFNTIHGQLKRAIHEESVAHPRATVDHVSKDENAFHIFKCE